jgi:membrane protease YdiL (CAAX protease family)
MSIVLRVLGAPASCCRDRCRLPRPFKWRVFVVLFVAGMLGVVAILPFAVDLLASLPVDQTASDMPMPLVVTLALVQNGILLAVAVGTGLVLSERIGLRMPLITAWATGQHSPKLKPVVIPGVLVGAAAGVVLVGVDALFFLRDLPRGMQSMFEIPLWKRLLSGLVYGGITEELLMRLFLLSLVAWTLGRWWKAPTGIPAPGAFWAAIIVVAFIFGLGHLPATAVVTPLTSALVARALVLNGVAGVAFGYLYWRHGLEAAMTGHMSAHVVMQIPGVMLLKTIL